MAFSIKKQANLNLKKNTTFKIPRTGSGAPIIWKIAIFGAGKNVLNGEYAWDGTTLENGKPKYYEVFNGDNYIFWNVSEWALYDADYSERAYISSDLITWQPDDGPAPAPTAVISYSQSSYINSIYFGFDAQNDFYDTIITRFAGGLEEFQNGQDILLTWNGSRWDATAYETLLYWSEDLFIWWNANGTLAVPSLIAGMTYSA
jgi:hypothetical protein